MTLPTVPIQYLDWLVCPSLLASAQAEGKVVINASYRCRAGVLQIACGLCCFACGAEDLDDLSVTSAAQALSLTKGPNELMIQGRRFVRESSLSEGELQELEDPSLWQKPETLDKVAQLSRLYITHTEYGPYIEAEPNYAIARIALGLDPSPLGERAVTSDSTEPGSVDKRISSNGDQRAIVASNTATPANAIALYEAGGSGAHLGSSRVYTAGHVLYNNSKVNGTNGWFCRDGSTSTAIPSCPSPQAQPRWRFGGKITNPGPNETWNFVGGWVSCGYAAIPLSWKNLASNASEDSTLAADWGYVDLTGCVPAGVGGLFWWLATQAELRTHSLNAFGYPDYTGCPAFSQGYSNTPGSDCVGGVGQSRPGFGNRPYTAGSVFVGVPVLDAALIAGTGFIKSNQVDTTANMSGGPFVAFSTSPMSAWWVVGAVSRGLDNGQGTGYNKLTTTAINSIYQ